MLEHSCKLSGTCLRHPGIDIWTYCFVDLKLGELSCPPAGCDEWAGGGGSVVKMSPGVRDRLFWKKISVANIWWWGEEGCGASCVTLSSKRGLEYGAGVRGLS